jgi:hypothetical protein
MHCVTSKHRRIFTWLRGVTQPWGPQIRRRSAQVRQVARSTSCVFWRLREVKEIKMFREILPPYNLRESTPSRSYGTCVARSFRVHGLVVSRAAAVPAPRCSLRLLGECPGEQAKHTSRSGPADVLVSWEHVVYIFIPSSLQMLWYSKILLCVFRYSYKRWTFSHSVKLSR